MSYRCDSVCYTVVWHRYKEECCSVTLSITFLISVYSNWALERQTSAKSNSKEIRLRLQWNFHATLPSNLFLSVTTWVFVLEYNPLIENRDYCVKLLARIIGPRTLNLIRAFYQQNLAECLNSLFAPTWKSSTKTKDSKRFMRRIRGWLIPIMHPTKPWVAPSSGWTIRRMDWN